MHFAIWVCLQINPIEYQLDRTLQKEDPNQTWGLFYMSAQGLLWVWYGGIRADPEKTQSRHREQALILEADTDSEPWVQSYKQTCQSW